MATYGNLPANIDPAKLDAMRDSIMKGITETLARVHGCSEAEVLDGIRAGHPKLCAQVKELAALGAGVALQMAADGKISITR